jgi:hypothetical protein
MCNQTKATVFSGLTVVIQPHDFTLQPVLHSKIPVVIEDAGVLAAFTHANRIVHYAHGNSLSFRLPALSMTWVLTLSQ